MSDLDELATALAAFSIHVGFPRERSALAGKLMSEGVTVAEVEALGDHCVRTVEGEAAAARVLMALLQDPDKRKVRLEDLKIVAAAKDRRLVQGRFGDKATLPAPTEGEKQAEWEHDRKCRIAFCRVVSDRRTVEDVAKELGVSVKAMGDMVARGRQLQHGHRKDFTPAELEQKEAESHEERVKKFREMMADKRS